MGDNGSEVAIDIITPGVGGSVTISPKAPVAIEPNDAEAIAQSFVPYNRDDDRARYLGLRASGFKIKEALKLVGVAKSTLSFWRNDAKFKECEDNLPHYRKQLAREYANLEFLRNYRLVLEKDYRILKKALGMYDEGEDKTLSKQECDYLLKLRAAYGPQQLEAIQTIMKNYGDSGDFDFTKLVLERSREKITMSRNGE